MTHATVLADRVIRGEGLAWDAARIVAANLLLVICAQVALPLPWTPVPITLQTFALMFIAVTLGARRSAIACAAYLLEGALGLPVFQPLGATGVLRLLGPTAGYLWSYPLAAFVTGWLVEKWAHTSIARLYTALAAGQMIVLASGWAWLATIGTVLLVAGSGQGVSGGLGWRAAFFAGVAPFVLGDILKMTLAVAATKGVELAGARDRAQS